MAILVLAVSAQAASPAPAPDPFAVIRVLEGRWEGAASGEPGKGTATREYRFDLRGKALVARNRSVYEPRSAGAEPEVHEDLGVFTYDKAAKKIVLRQFHGEGFVNEYVLAEESPDGASFTFVTVRIENIPAGWRAREAYQVLSRDEVVETFSLAEPGKDFQTYSVTRLKRRS
jgi:hypothetical protein